MSEKKEWLVWSNEHNAFWGPNAHGYVIDPELAGRYTKEEAKQHCKDVRNTPAAPDKEIMLPAPEATYLLPGFISSLQQEVRQGREDSVRLQAWTNIFGTTQLSHAQARLQKAEGDAKHWYDWAQSVATALGGGEARQYRNDAKERIRVMDEQSKAGVKLASLLRAHLAFGASEGKISLPKEIRELIRELAPGPNVPERSM